MAAFVSVPSYSSKHLEIASNQSCVLHVRTPYVVPYSNNIDQISKRTFLVESLTQKKRYLTTCPRKYSRNEAHLVFGIPLSFLMAFRFDIHERMKVKPDATLCS